MKILLVTEYFYPQSSGGTELYVYNLAKSLQNRLHEVIILSVNEGGIEKDNYDNLPVYYIPFNKNFQTEIINGQKPSDNLEYFRLIIQEINPYIIHFHTLTTSIGVHHIDAAKLLNFKLVLTSHIASHTCVRGNLLQLGKKVCDGIIEKNKCLKCYLQHRNIPVPLNNFAAFGIQFTGFPKNIAKVVDHKKEELASLEKSIDRLVVVSNWQREIFIKNGFDPQKIALCRQAICDPPINKNLKTDKKNLILGFVGRISKIKGLHILLDALENIDTNKIELHVAAIPVKDELEYYHYQKTKAENLPNCVWKENLPNEEIGDFLQTLDVLCVPSQWLETGPFVVYEALAQGIPVLGSDLGGISELISEDINGWLFPYRDKKKLSFLINTLIVQKRNDKLLKNVKPIDRPVENLADEMLKIYHEL